MILAAAAASAQLTLSRLWELRPTFIMFCAFVTEPQPKLAQPEPQMTEEEK